MTSTATRLLRLAALVELSPDPHASCTLDGDGAEFGIALQAEDRPDEPPFRYASGIDEALEVGMDWAREITPGVDATAVQDVHAPAELEVLVEQALPRWPTFNLAWIPRSPVVRGPAWELVVGDDELVYLDHTLPDVLRAWLQDH